MTIDLNKPLRLNGKELEVLCQLEFGVLAREKGGSDRWLLSIDNFGDAMRVGEWGNAGRAENVPERHGCVLKNEGVTWNCQEDDAGVLSVYAFEVNGPSGTEPLSCAPLTGKLTTYLTILTWVPTTNRPSVALPNYSWS